METIEIGAVKLNAQLEIIDEFSTFIRPVIRPQLSEFCVRFTSIRQADVEQAALFPAVFADFLAWIGAEPYLWYSWSSYDRKRLHGDLVHHGRPIPEFFERHYDLKRLYAACAALAKPVGMRRALKQIGVVYAGRQHRGIDDARNTAEILKYVLAGR